MTFLKALRKDEVKGEKIPILLGFSPSGRVKGEVVYANFGAEEDFGKLKDLGVSVKDKIVIIRQGRIFRGNKVRALTTHPPRPPRVLNKAYAFY